MYLWALKSLLNYKYFERKPHQVLYTGWKTHGAIWQPTTNLTNIWQVAQGRNRNPGHIAGERAISPPRHPWSSTVQSTQHKMFFSIFPDFVYRRLCIRFGSLLRPIHHVCPQKVSASSEGASDLIYLGTQTLADFLDNDTCKGTADKND